MTQPGDTPAVGSHLVWEPGDKRSICGLKEPLPVMWARFASAHMVGHRLAGRVKTFCRICLQIGAHGR